MPTTHEQDQMRADIQVCGGMRGYYKPMLKG